jgi:kynurenine formamidase
VLHNAHGKNGGKSEQEEAEEPVQGEAGGAPARPSAPAEGSRATVAILAVGRWTMRRSLRLIELSHPIHHGLVTCPGLPVPEYSDHLTRERSEASYAPGVTFHIGRVSLITNTGTYLDSPFHRFEGGVDLAALPLERMVELEGVVVRARGSDRRGIDAVQLAAVEVKGRAVLLHTGWDVHFETERYAVDAPFLTADGADWLVNQGAALVGIDAINIDDLDDRTRPAHSRLLAAGIPIVEHLRGLDQLPATGFRFSAAPPRFRGLGTFPVRAYAVLG